MKHVNELDKHEILRLYQSVFDIDANVRSCGRESCKRLICALQQDCDNRKLSDVYDFGNADTGVMNVVTIHCYISKFFS